MSLHAALTISAALLTPNAVPEDTSADLARLRGEWSLVSTQDAKRADLGSEGLRMVVGEEGRVAFGVGDLKTNEGSFRAVTGGAGKVRPIDLKLADGRTLPGLYRLQGDELFFCFAEAGQARPAGIEPKGSEWLERWKRVRP
jgi:uncharacterized protein (TIGR03067 family)